MYRHTDGKYRSQGHPCESFSNYCKESVLEERQKRLSKSRSRVPDSYDQYMTILSSREVNRYDT